MVKLKVGQIWENVHGNKRREITGFEITDDEVLQMTYNCTYQDGTIHRECSSGIWKESDFYKEVDTLEFPKEETRVTAEPWDHPVALRVSPEGGVYPAKQTDYRLEKGIIFPRIRELQMLGWHLVSEYVCDNATYYVFVRYD